MKKRKISLVSTTLILTGSLIGMSHAAFVKPDLVGSNGTGPFNPNFNEINMINNTSVTSATSTIDADDSASGILYATPSTSGPTIALTITMDFNSATDLGGFYLWNSARGGTQANANNGIKDFTLTFYDAAGGSSGAGSQIGAVYTGVAAKANASGNNSAEVFGFGLLYSNAFSVDLNATSRYSGDDNWTGIREIGFDTAVVAVPEPSTTALLGLGGLALILRRRK